MRIWHCETQEQYDYLMRQLEAEGCTWRGGGSPTQHDYWGGEREETCVREKEGLLGFQNKEHFEYLYPTIKIQPVEVTLPKETYCNKLNKQELIDKLDEPQKVVLPRDVADWIEEQKTNYVFWNNYSKGEFVICCANDLLRYGKHELTYDFNINDRISKWIHENPYEFVRAIIDGYEVE